MNPRYEMRERTNQSIFQLYNISEADFQDDSSSLSPPRQYKPRLHSSESEDEEIGDIMDKLPHDKKQLEVMLKDLEEGVKIHKAQFLRDEESRYRASYVGPNSVPICADITRYNFSALIDMQLKAGGRPFDVIMMDPPWKLSTSQPSRGVAIQYDSLSDELIEKLPIDKLQSGGGVLAVWAINAKYAFTMKLMEKVWGYRLVDSITWVKKTVNGKIAKGHGFYLQHAKETCLIGVKGNGNYCKHVASDVIFSDRRGQSQKPTEIYDYLESLVPEGFYLQIFGRRNNLRNKWVTIGNEI